MPPARSATSDTEVRVEASPVIYIAELKDELESHIMNIEAKHEYTLHVAKAA